MGLLKQAGSDSERESGLFGRRVVIATFGSLGDLHPYLAVAKALAARGAIPVIATSELHRARVERQGLGFHAVRPNLKDFENDPENFRRAMDLKEGPQFVIREVFMKHLRESYEDLLAAVSGADFLVSHPITYAAPIVAEVMGLPWVSTSLAPLSMFSRHDPPILPLIAWSRHLRPLGPAFWGALLGLGRWKARSWGEPVAALRKELGLEECRNPLIEGGNSPHGVLAMFSEVLGAPQPDWPQATVQTGFAFLDNSLGEEISVELARFLDDGPPPVVFTLGSSAVMDAGRFYTESLAAVQSLGCRAVFLIGNDPRNRSEASLPSSVIAEPYAPYSQLFPLARAIVHQGGVGTTAQALRAGRPMLVVPWSHDQPDNADRIRRLGVGLTVTRARYNARYAETALRRLLDEPGFAARADLVGHRVRAEDGVNAWCDAFERCLIG